MLKWTPESSQLSPFKLPIGEAFLERYEIIDLVGAGAFGVVYHVFDNVLQRDVALKLPRPEVLIDDDLRQRFANEAILVAKLEHPGIAKLYEARLDLPICYFTSDYCVGSDLAKWLQANVGRKHSWQSVVNFVRKVAEATHYAHQQGVYHQDLKPANILLSPIDETNAVAASSLEQFQPKLTDFGLAKLVDLTNTQNLSSLIAGTPLYMAPEQFSKKQKVDHLPAADTYSLGVILFELLAGHGPFTADTYAEIIDAHRSAQPLKLSKFRQGLPANLQRVCDRCLAKDPAARYVSAGELADDLKSIASDKSFKVRRNGLLSKFRWWAKQPERISFAGWYTILTALILTFWLAIVVVLAPMFGELTAAERYSLWVDLANIACLRVPLYLWLASRVLKFKRWAIYFAMVTSIARTVAAILMVGQPIFFNAIYKEGGPSLWVDHSMILIVNIGQVIVFALAVNADLARHQKSVSN